MPICYIRNLNTTARALSLCSENYKGEIKMLSFSEKSGFELKKLSTGFYYSDQQAGVNDLILLTSNTNLRSKSELKYASIASLSDKPGDLSADLVFDHSYIGMKDILLLVPSLRSRLHKEQNARIRINGRINGKLNNLNIPDLELAGLQHTQLEMSGQIRGLPDAKKAIYHLQIKNLSTFKTGYQHLPARKQSSRKIFAFRIPFQSMAVLMEAWTSSMWIWRSTPVLEEPL